MEEPQWKIFTDTSSNLGSYLDKEITHSAICYTTSFNAQAALSWEQGILLLATNPLSDAPSYSAEMCSARAERHSPPGQPLPREAVLTGAGAAGVAELSAQSAGLK